MVQVHAGITQDGRCAGTTPMIQRSGTATLIRYSLVAGACFLVLIACRNSQDKKLHSIPAVIEHAPKPESSQSPYYYGLIEEYRIILAGDPHNLAAMIGLGNAYSESGAWREAIIEYEEALKLDPHNSDVYSDMGTAYRNIGLPDQALVHYRTALKYEPGHLDARYNMGMVYAFDLRNYHAAIQLWEQVLRLAPNYPHADYMRNCIVNFNKIARKAP